MANIDVHRAIRVVEVAVNRAVQRGDVGKVISVEIGKRD
jgi:hypothetical protein